MNIILGIVGIVIIQDVCDVLDIFMWVSNRLIRTKAKTVPIYLCAGLWLPASLSMRLSVTKDNPQGFLVLEWPPVLILESLDMQLERVKKDPVRLCTRLVHSETE